MREMRASRLHANGIEIAAYEWPGNEPSVFFAHATGFHARCWLQVIERLPGIHCYAIDMRGHGLSEKPAPPYRWRLFADDVAAAGRALGLSGALAVGHSKGGYAVVGAAAREPELFGRLLLIDPVILSRERYGSRFGADHFAARRRNHWSSPEEMFARFKDRSPFVRWDPAVLRDYCTYGLVPAPDGDGYVLACPPEIEAATYAESAQGPEIYEDIAQVTVPVRILRARGRQQEPAEGEPMDMSGSPTTPDLATHFVQAEDVPLPQYSHFIPMEDPGFVASQVQELANLLRGRI